MNKKGFIFPFFLPLIVLVLVVVIILNNTKVKTPITMEDFQKKIVEYGYEINEDAKVENISVCDAKKEDSIVDFFVTENEEDAIRHFNTLVDTYKSMSGTYFQNHIVLAHTGKYNITTSKNYIIVSRIDNTILCSITQRKNKKEMKKLVKELGY